MPAGLRGYEGDVLDEDVEDSNMGTCVILSVPEHQLYIRTHNYYMGKISLSFYRRFD